jgi:hypothetical protein
MVPSGLRSGSQVKEREKDKEKEKEKEKDKAKAKEQEPGKRERKKEREKEKEKAKAKEQEQERERERERERTRKRERKHLRSGSQATPCPVYAARMPSPVSAHAPSTAPTASYPCEGTLSAHAPSHRPLHTSRRAALRVIRARQMRKRKGRGAHLRAADAAGRADAAARRTAADDDLAAAGHCPGRKPPFSVLKRPARPYKSRVQNRFTWENAEGA